MWGSADARHPHRRRGGAPYRRDSTPPVEMTRSHLDRIRPLDPKLNAFLQGIEERALADA
jgi:Asp-tRNA(Asn)/Glu-tRNA(Gln) amidotransferase A subunit family amidase